VSRIDFGLEREGREFAEARRGFARATAGQIAPTDPEMEEGVAAEKHVFVSDVKAAASPGVERGGDDFKNPISELD
jgi:hypothetical protein